MNSRFAWLALSLMLASTAAARPFGGAYSCPTDGRSSDQRFLAGLRQRGLYELAETYCATRLGRDDLPDTQRADLVIELSRCLAERAVSSPPKLRGPLWQRAVQVTGDFARGYPQDPRLPLVRLQQALGHLARGELARQEAQFSADQANLLDQARAHLRVAIGELEELADEVQRRLREQSRPGRDEPDGLDAHQLASLQKNVQYELARARRNQAQCYPADSPDRTNSLTRAVELLERLAGLDPVDPLSWKSRLDLIVSYRLLGDYAAAQRQLDALLALKPSPPFELRARAEQIRLALATGRLPEAISALSQGRQIEGTTSPELDYAWLETYLAAGRAAADASHNTKAAGWQAKATEQVERIEQLHGPYWARRAGMLLASYVRGSSRPFGGTSQMPHRWQGDLALLVRAAESFFRSEQFDDALDAYDRARALAARAGDSDWAFELGYTAAAVEHRRRRHEEALDRYRRLATQTPDHPKAADAHELAIYNAAQILKAQPQGTSDRYTALLQEHLRTWPGGPGADRVRRQLGRLREYQRDWQAAIRAYQAISPDDAEFLQAARAVERCYRAWLAELGTAGEPPGATAGLPSSARLDEPTVAPTESEQIATQAADWYESMVVGPQGQMPQRWSPLQRFAVLAAARLRLDYTATGYARTQKLLSIALRSDANAPPEWKSAAELLLVVSLAGQGRSGEADGLLKQTSAGSPEQLLGMLRGLNRVAATAAAEVRGDLAGLQLRTIKMLSDASTRFSPAQQRTLERIQAQALADGGQTGEALQAYEALAKAHPRDGAIQEAYAKLLLTRVDDAPTEAARKESITTALEKWRELEQKSPPRSRRWFLAKYWVARLHVEQGNKARAAKIITLLQLLHPEMGGPELKPQFEELLSRCRE